MIPLALICAALIALVVWERHQSILRERLWIKERSLLLTRIQHPEIVIQDEALPPEPFYGNEPEVDEIDMVGEIVGAPSGD